MSQIGVAVIGAGLWGATLARTFAALPSADLRWIVEIDAARRDAARRAQPEARVTGNIEEALDDPAVRAAVVAVDSARHCSVGLRALAAGRHALVEKPLALSVADAAALCESADAHGRLLTVGHLLLHHPAVHRAKQLLDSGALGRPLYFEARRTAIGTARRGTSAWWALAPHDVSLALYLFGGTPTAVSAVGRRDDRTSCDVAAFATLHFADGRMAHLHAARFAPAKERRFALVGSERAISFDELAPTPALLVRESARPGSVPPVDRIEIAGGDPLYAQCAHFTACAARGDLLGGNAAHGLAVVRVLEAGVRSMAAGGAPVEVA